MSLDPPARIAILGGGAAGIEAALYGRFLGYRVELILSGAIGDAWQDRHLEQLSRPFGECSSTLGRAALRAQNSQHDLPGEDERLMLGQWLEGYLLPLCQTDLLADSIREHCQIAAMQRERCTESDVAGDESNEGDEGDDEEGAPRDNFILAIRGSCGEETLEVQAVIDLRGVDSEMAGVANYLPIASWGIHAGEPDQFPETLVRIRDLFAELFGRADLDVYQRVKGL